MVDDTNMCSSPVLLLLFFRRRQYQLKGLLKNCVCRLCRYVRLYISVGVESVDLIVKEKEFTRTRRASFEIRICFRQSLIVLGCPLFGCVDMTLKSSY